jgi:Tfp pilus assembly protein PilF
MRVSELFKSPRYLSHFAMAALISVLSVSCGCQTMAINDTNSTHEFAEKSATASSPEALMRSIKKKLLTPVGSSVQQPAVVHQPPIAQVEETPSFSRFNTLYSKLIQPPSYPKEKVQEVQADQSEQILAGRQLEQQGNLSEAIRIYESALQNGNRSKLVFHRLAVLYDQTGQLQRAVPLYQQVLASDPNNVEILCDFGFNLYLLGNFQESERLYRMAIISSPNHARTHNNLAVLLAQSGRQQEAMEHFTIAGLNPEQSEHNMEVAVLISQEMNGGDINGLEQAGLRYSDQPDLR